jgi:hypothetical protein
VRPVRPLDTILRSLRDAGILADVERFCREAQMPLALVLGSSTERDVCSVRRRIWLWLHDHRRFRTDHIAELWGVSESTVWYGLRRAAPGPSGWARVKRLDALGVRREAEAICAECGVSVEDLMSGSKRPAIVQARRRVWRLLLASGKKPREIAAAWGMDRKTVAEAREAA